jgi:hypothetical protein
MGKRISWKSWCVFDVQFLLSVVLLLFFASPYLFILSPGINLWQFHLALFELADLWTLSIDLSEYISFLKDLYLNIASHHGNNPDHPWRYKPLPHQFAPLSFFFLVLVSYRSFVFMVLFLSSSFLLFLITDTLFCSVVNWALLKVEVQRNY